MPLGLVAAESRTAWYGAPPCCGLKTGTACPGGGRRVVLVLGNVVVVVGIVVVVVDGVVVVVDGVVVVVVGGGS